MTTQSRTVFRILLLAFIVLSTFAAQAETVSPVSLPEVPSALITKPISVDDAVAFALAHNPAVTLAGQNVQVAQYQLDAARAGVKPSLGLGLNWTYWPSATPVSFPPFGTISGFTYPTNAEAVVNQPLFPFSRLRAPVQSAHANVGITQESLVRTRQQVAFQTRQAYYQLLIAQNLLQVSNYSVQVAQGQLTLAQDNENAGTAPHLDVLQAQSTLENANVSKESAQNNVDVSRATLATQLGLPAGAPVQIVLPIKVPVAPKEVEPLVTQALTSRPDLAQMLYRRRQLQATIALTRVEEYPKVDLQASYSRIVDGSALLEPEGVSIGVNIAFSAFDWGKSRADVKAIKTQLAEVDTTESLLALSTTLDVRSAWLNLLNATAQLDSAEKQFDAANEALRISELRYRNGVGIYLELQQAYLSATQALTSFSQATYQAQTAAAQLEFAVGAPVTLTSAPIPALTFTVPPPLPAPAVPVAPR
jgi:outer membrane protein TolC